MLTEYIGMEEVLPGVWRVGVPLKGNPLKELNSYVVLGKAGGTKNLLIDTGFRTRACKEALFWGLSRLGVRMEETDILLTHLHADHCGNGPDLVKEGNRIFIGRTDGEIMVGAGEWKAENFGDAKRGRGLETIHGRKRERLREHGICPGLIEEMLRRVPSCTMASCPDFADYTFLDEGDALIAGQYQLRAIEAPGHTPGQMCFELEGTGAMILGDHVLFDITPNITDWPQVRDSLGNYLDSLTKLDGYDVKIPLPGHRKPGDYHGRIRQLKDHHKMRLEECRQAVKRLGKAGLYEIGGSMTWNIRVSGWDEFPPAQRWFALGECLAHLDHLKEMGQIEEHREGGVIWYEA